MAIALPSVADLDTDNGYPSKAWGEACRARLTDKVFENRRIVQGLTIDPPHSIDLDDAIHMEPLPDGGWKVEVSIADVDALVAPGSHLDAEALRRVATRYYGSFNHPMLPQRLSENLLSLHEAEKRPAVTVRIRLGSRAGVTDIQIERTILTSRRRLSYAEAGSIIGGGRPDPEQAFLVSCNLLAQKLRARRLSSGALSCFEGLGSILDEGGHQQPNDLHETAAHSLIEEFMVLANEAVGRFAVDGDIPVLFRNHRRHKGMHSQESIARILSAASKCTSDRIAEFLHENLLRWFKRATYDEKNEGHFALASRAYVHFTSPIRRYPDVVSHRNVLAAVEGKPLPYSRAELDDLGRYCTEKQLRIDYRERAAMVTGLPNGEGHEQYMRTLIAREAGRGHYLGALNNVSRLLGVDLPEFSLVDIPISQHLSLHGATVAIRGNEGECTAQGWAQTPHAAKANAAMNMLVDLGFTDIPPQEREKMIAFLKAIHEHAQSSEEVLANATDMLRRTDPHKLLVALCVKHGYSDPRFEQRFVRDADKRRWFGSVARVTAPDREILQTPLVRGAKKTVAKQHASLRMIPIVLLNATRGATPAAE